MTWVSHWLHPDRDPQRFDAVLAAEIEAKQSAGHAADALAKTARERGRHVAGVQAEIRKTIRQHTEIESPLGGTTGGIREMVAEMLHSLDEPPNHEEGRGK